MKRVLLRNRFWLGAIAMSFPLGWLLHGFSHAQSALAGAAMGAAAVLADRRWSR